MNFSGILIGVLTFFLIGLLGVLCVSCFWSIKELKEQEKRVAKGWFPKRKVDKH